MKALSTINIYISLCESSFSEVSSCKNGKAVCLPTANCDCTWKPWQEWSCCNKPCGNGTLTRIREIEADQRGNGKACDGTDLETKPCDLKPCPNCTESGKDEVVMSGSPMTPDSVCVEWSVAS